MIYTVSTIKDSTENIEAFIARNLAAGADHMFLFLEGDDAAAQARTLDGPHVTAIPTADPAYWQGERPSNLNARQIANVNLANNLLAPFKWADWLFHIDGDEVLDIDVDYLATVPAEVHAVRLRPLEAVALDHWPGEVTHFKKRLRDHELVALHAAGRILAPHNSAYFRGHTIGKTGFRPSPYLAPRIHAVKTHNGAKIEHRADHRLRLLHYESATGAEFIRKWTALVAKGNSAAFRAERRVIAAEVRAILDSRAPEPEKESALWAVFHRYGRDDLHTLDRLGLLVQPDPDRHQYAPTEHTAHQAELLHDLLPHLIAADRRYFRPGFRAYHPLDLIRHLTALHVKRRPDLAKRLAYAARR